MSSGKVEFKSRRSRRGRITDVHHRFFRVILSAPPPSGNTYSGVYENEFFYAGCINLAADPQWSKKLGGEEGMLKHFSVK